MKLPILFEDNDLMVIDKPSGIVVNRAESVKNSTITDLVEEYFKSKNLNLGNDGDFFQRQGIVHRLDKETSGCLIIAKNINSFMSLQSAFKARSVKKKYLALVHGRITQTGEINVPIGRLPWNREQFGVVPGGKEAFTKFKRLSVFRFKPTRNPKTDQLEINNKQLFSLVELTPETGRTHQLRVHLKYLGFPVVGDYLYGGRKQHSSDRLWCPRVFLHAGEISFPHPVTDEMTLVKSPLPQELAQILGRLIKLD